MKKLVAAVLIVQWLFLTFGHGTVKGEMKEWCGAIAFTIQGSNDGNVWVNHASVFAPANPCTEPFWFQINDVPYKRVRVETRFRDGVEYQYAVSPVWLPAVLWSLG